MPLVCHPGNPGAKSIAGLARAKTNIAHGYYLQNGFYNSWEITTDHAASTFIPGKSPGSTRFQIVYAYYIKYTHRAEDDGMIMKKKKKKFSMFSTVVIKKKK